tara:strand:- start:24099 stop:24632 length:534 start_codon:yes stop_codon:yes gene_type:complete
MDKNIYIIILSFFITGCNFSDPETKKDIDTIKDVKCLKYFSYDHKYNLCFEGGSFSCDNRISFEEEKKLCFKQINNVFFKQRKKHLEKNYKLNQFFKNNRNEKKDFKKIKEYTEETFYKNIEQNKNYIFNNYYKHCFKKFQYAYCDNYTNLLNKINRDLYSIFDNIEILLNKKYEKY